MNNSPKQDDLVYTQHVFFCTNECAPCHPRELCKARGSDKLRTHIKVKTNELVLDRTRNNSARWSDRCELGQIFVIYREGVWYKCETTADVDGVLIEHMKKGNHVNDQMLGANE